MIRLAILAAVLTACASASHGHDGYSHQLAYVPHFQPRHVHLAYGRNTTEVVVTWSTISLTGASYVKWGKDLFRLATKTGGSSKRFNNSPNGPSSQYIHRVHWGCC